MGSRSSHHHPEIRHRLRHPHPATTELILVRHGRTAANVLGVLQGTTDVPLDAHGLQQAQRAATRIAAEYDLDHIVSSPLSRARVTAEIIAQHHDVPFETHPDLQEMSFGRYEGLTWSEVRRIDPVLAARFEDIHDDDAEWPGGDQRRRFHDRVWGVLESLVDEHPHKRVLVVAHGGVIGVLMAMLREQSPNDPVIYGLRNCSITHLEVGTDHTIVHRFDDVDHLADLVEIV